MTENKESGSEFMSRITKDLVEMTGSSPTHRRASGFSNRIMFMKRAILLIVWIFLGEWVAGITYGISDMFIGFAVGKIPFITNVEACLPLLYLVVPVIAFILGTKGILPAPAGCGPKVANRFVRAAFVASILIHALFTFHAFLSLQFGGMVSNEFYFLFFFPHYTMDYFLPPAYPIDYVDGVVKINYFGLWGKILVAFPASLAYGTFLAGLVVKSERTIAKEA